MVLKNFGMEKNKMNTCALVLDRIPRNVVHPLILFYREIFSEDGALRKYFPKLKEKDTRTVRELWDDYYKNDWGEDYEMVLLNFDNGHSLVIVPEFTNNKNYINLVIAKNLKNVENSSLESITIKRKSGDTTIKIPALVDNFFPEEIAELVPYPLWGNVNSKFIVSPKR